MLDEERHDIPGRALLTRLQPHDQHGRAPEYLSKLLLGETVFRAAALEPLSERG
jgi:hypothetical protein